jgi:hypothetical protein
MIESCMMLNSNCSDNDFLAIQDHCISPVENAAWNSLSSQPAYKLKESLILYISPILLVLGIIGNSLSFVVLIRQTKKMSTYSYLSALAIMDISVLLVGLLRLWIAEITGSDIKDASDVTCKLVQFLGYVCSDSSVWLIITVTTERYIAVCHPLQTQMFCKIGRAWKALLLPILIICVINSHFFFTVSIQQKSDSVECQATPSFELLVNNIWPWVDAVIYSFLPFVIIGVLNGFIIRKISQAEKERKIFLQVKHRTARELRRYKSSDNKKLTTMLLSVSFAFLLTTIPMNIAVIFTAFWNKRPDRDVEGAAIFHLIKAITELLMYVNHSINFFLYCATGQKFRRSLMQLFCRRRFRNASHDKTHFTSLRNTQ